MSLPDEPPPAIPAPLPPAAVPPPTWSNSVPVWPVLPVPLSKPPAVPGASRLSSSIPGSRDMLLPALPPPDIPPPPIDSPDIATLRISATRRWLQDHGSSHPRESGRRGLSRHKVATSYRRIVLVGPALNGRSHHARPHLRSSIGLPPDDRGRSVGSRGRT